MKKSLLSKICIIASPILLFADPALSRSQWEIQHPTLPPAAQPDSPGQMPGELHKSYPPQFQKPGMVRNFWQGQMPGFSNRLQPGIMLTGVLEDEISSGKSKVGDLFALNLEDGFVQNGMQVIPKGSKIVGAITHVVPAKKQRVGHPGSLQVSMQSVVFPDGSHIPFAGFIAINPNHGVKEAPRKRNLGFDVRDTGHHIAGMMGSFTNGVGFIHARQQRGNDFYLDKGELVPVRLNKTLVIPEYLVRPVETAQMSQQGQPASLPGLSPNLPALPPPSVPGLSDPAPATSAVPGLLPDADPFAVPLTNPAAKSLGDLPEPF